MANVMDGNAITRMANQLGRMGDEHVQLNNQGTGIVRSSGSVFGRMINWISSTFSNHEAQKNLDCLTFVRNSVQANMGDAYSELFNVKIGDAILKGKPVSGREVAVALRELTAMKTENDSIALENAIQTNERIIDSLFNPMNATMREKMTPYLAQRGFTVENFPKEAMDNFVRALNTHAELYSTDNLIAVDDARVIGFIDNAIIESVNEAIGIKGEELVANVDPSIKAQLESALTKHGLTGKIPDCLVKEYADQASRSMYLSVSEVPGQIPTQEVANAQVAKKVSKFAENIGVFNEINLPSDIKAHLIKSVFESRAVSKNLIDASAACLTEENIETVRTLFALGNGSKPLSLKTEMLALEEKIRAMNIAAHERDRTSGANETDALQRIVIGAFHNIITEASPAGSMRNALALRTAYDLQIEDNNAQIPEDEISAFKLAKNLTMMHMIQFAEGPVERNNIDFYSREIPDGMLFPDDLVAIEKANLGKSTYAPTVIGENKEKVINFLQADKNNSPSKTIEDGVTSQLARYTDALNKLHPDTPEHKNIAKEYNAFVEKISSELNTYLAPFSEVFILDFSRGIQLSVDGTFLANLRDSDSDQTKLEKMQNLVSCFPNRATAAKVLRELHQNCFNSMYQALQLNKQTTDATVDFLTAEAKTIAQEMKFEVTTNSDGTFSVKAQLAHQKTSGDSVQAKLQLHISNVADAKPTITVLDADIAIRK